MPNRTTVFVFGLVLFSFQCCGLGKLFAQNPKQGREIFRDLVQAIDSRRDELMPCKVECVKIDSSYDSHQRITKTWYGGGYYVTKLGEGYSLSVKLEPIQDDSEFAGIMLANDAYYAMVLIEKNSTSTTPFFLNSVEKNEGVGYDKTHPVMDTTRVATIFDSYSELLGKEAVSYEVSDGGESLTVKWSGIIGSNAVGVELEFDVKLKRCRRQRTEWPTESAEVNFEYKEDQVIPAAAIYSGSGKEKNSYKYELRYDVDACGVDDSDQSACFLSFYDLPEPAFYQNGNQRGWLSYGVVVVVALVVASVVWRKLVNS